MPRKAEGVYADGQGGWYFKVTLGKDPLTGRRVQVTKRGFRSAAEAGRARRELLSRADAGLVTSTPATLTVNQLLDLYLDGLDADAKLSVKTRFDYRRSAESYVRPRLGARKVRDVTPEVILAWQRALAKNGAQQPAAEAGFGTGRLTFTPVQPLLCQRSGIMVLS